MRIRENICDGGSWIKWFRIAQNGSFVLAVMDFVFGLCGAG